MTKTTTVPDSLDKLKAARVAATTQPGRSPGDADAAWVLDMMQRNKDKDVAGWVDVLSEDLRRHPGHDSQYLGALHAGMAQLLEGVKGADPELQQMLSFTVGNMLKAEEKVRQTKVAASMAHEKPSDGNLQQVLAEDRILNAMASLLEDAKGKEPAHQRAMARATADITAAIKGIKEVRQKETHYAYADQPPPTYELPSPVTPGTGPGTARVR